MFLRSFLEIIIIFEEGKKAEEFKTMHFGGKAVFVLFCEEKCAPVRESLEPGDLESPKPAPFSENTKEKKKAFGMFNFFTVCETGT